MDHETKVFIFSLGRGEEADELERAVETVLDDGWRTPDIKIEGDGCKLIGCKEMGERVADAIRGE